MRLVRSQEVLLQQGGVFPFDRPQSAATLDALLCMQTKSWLPFSNSNPQFEPTDITNECDCPESDEELGIVADNLSKAEIRRTV